jgi:hypothetical protein
MLSPATIYAVVIGRMGDIEMTRELSKFSEGCFDHSLEMICNIHEHRDNNNFLLFFSGGNRISKKNQAFPFA